MSRLIGLLIFMGLTVMVSPHSYKLSDLIPDDFERTYDCDPDPDCGGAAFGDVVPDPMSCNSYYICLGPDKPTDVPVPCDPPENVFDADAGTADAPCIADDPAKPCVPLCGGSCLITCNNTYDLVADFTDCQKYYVCMPSGPIEFTCPADTPYFDGASCTTTKAACCKPECNLDVVCTGHPQEQIPDPTNCNGGIICVNETFPYQYDCPGGCIFDSAANACEEPGSCEKSCTSSCDVTTGGTGAGGSTAAGVTTPAGGTTGAGDTTPPGGTTGAGGSTPAGGTTGAVTTAGGGTTSACLDSLDCSTANGAEFIARCTTCDPSYFKCTSSSGQATIGECSGDLVFNPDPLYPYCIQSENCPFHPGK